MNTFKIRIPTIQEWEDTVECFSSHELHKLHWEAIRTSEREHGFYFAEFHLADAHPQDFHRHAIGGHFMPLDHQYAYTTSEHEKKSFRPVLEATGDTDLSCITDGSIVQMGAIMLNGQHLPIPGDYEAPPIWPEKNMFGTPPIGLDPFSEGKGNSISWIKCGNILIADRCLFDNISYKQLSDHGLVKGAKLEMPFDKAAAKLFYELSMQQPDSEPRHIGEIMRDLTLELENLDCEICSDQEALFTLAAKIHSCWCSISELSLGDIVLSTANMIRDGLEDFCYKRGESYYVEDFSSEVVGQVLRTCDQSVFNVLIENSMELSPHFSLEDDLGSPTDLARALNMLQSAEHAREEDTAKLDMMISGAKNRRSAQYETKNAVVPDQVR